jgi:Kef-type K+ transport system membrane component KefB
MHADAIPLFTGLIIFISSIISLRLGISVAIVEILLGSVAGNFGLHTEEWMQYLAGFGGIVLTYYLSFLSHSLRFISCIGAFKRRSSRE